MSYHRERRPQGVGAIAAQGRAPRSAPAPEFQVRPNRQWSRFVGSRGLGRIMEDRPDVETRPGRTNPEPGGSGPVQPSPPPPAQTPPIIKIPGMPPIEQMPPPPPGPTTPTCVSPYVLVGNSCVLYPGPKQLPKPEPDPVPPVPKPGDTCVFPMGWVNGQCVLVGGIVPPMPQPQPPTVPIVNCIRAPCPGSTTPPVVTYPPIEVDDIEIQPVPPAPKSNLLPALLIGGGVLVGIALLRKR